MSNQAISINSAVYSFNHVSYFRPCVVNMGVVGKLAFYPIGVLNHAIGLAWNITSLAICIISLTVGVLATAVTLGCFKKTRNFTKEAFKLSLDALLEVGVNALGCVLGSFNYRIEMVARKYIVSKYFENISDVTLAENNMCDKIRNYYNGYTSDED